MNQQSWRPSRMAAGPPSGSNSLPVGHVWRSICGSYWLLCAVNQRPAPEDHESDGEVRDMSPSVSEPGLNPALDLCVCYRHKLSFALSQKRTSVKTSSESPDIVTSSAPTILSWWLFSVRVWGKAGLIVIKHWLLQQGLVPPGGAQNVFTKCKKIKFVRKYKNTCFSSYYIVRIY